MSQNIAPRLGLFTLCEICPPALAAMAALAGKSEEKVKKKD
jgi:hypothetical protein